ncbi:Serine/threonine-protein kinase ssp1 [Fulvia fulva]|uniref:non-specific serine/threonine protein kinase n=1 Tax=Passalora fulva TaxID=5499 RepID=A0A9Q8PL07_PASFU|nr:Serine/threonine-protein kinase ssp1 [Fulvia fulva]KAK4610894.1 Serine/threonine-protein kinase ssp1 [Fulvia fulva]UJO24365.1 Serine/threonine-protein kinase ssp1 [Fulvia fulva]WPV36754.1 Serine/threonine-protein kinase ssp1 [Fulvia fulva]
MSTPSSDPDHSSHGHLAPQEVPAPNGGNTEDTPRSEVPPALSVITPNATEALARLSEEGPNDYFTPQPAATTTHAPPNHEFAAPAHSTGSRSPTASVGTSDATAAGHIELPESLSSLHVSGRPPPHTTPSSLSIESAASSTTVTPSHSGNSTRPELSSWKTAYPNPYPVQNFAALHSQQYPPYYVPHVLRRGNSTQPHQISTFASAIASLHSSGARTSTNSPALTPSVGLFNPSGPPSAPVEHSEKSGTYASPFLHFTHTHVPKETHVADVDVDPVSGRKLINHYEVVDELGRGTHGKVKLGRDLESPANSPTYVAIKIVERFSKRRKLGRLGTTEDKVKKEVAILKKARHPNVVALLEVIDDPTRKKVYIVLEWVENGEIKWRTKAPKEIAMIEARRYEREKSGQISEAKLAEDGAVLMEVQKRLAKQKRRQMQQYRQMRRGAADDPQSWSIEMAGDNESEDSQDDRLSRISSLTATSDAGRLSVDPLGRRPSRTPSPLHPCVEPNEPGQFLSLTGEPEIFSPIATQDQPRRPSQFSLTGLEGTMYGAYDSSLSQTSRVASLNSLTSSRGSSDSLAKFANEVLDSELDVELQNVPIMAMEDIKTSFRDTLLGLQYLHGQGIVHRDIKPPNLLSTGDSRVKISDFGVSYLGRPVHEGETEDISEADATDLDDEAKELAKTVGTPAFYAPELCIVDPTDDPLPVTKAIDVWALGVTLFCMIFARTPFVDNEFVVMRQIADEEIYLPRKRLLPVDTKPKSRPNSHARAFPPRATSRRHELDLVYEDIDDNLHDLLKRLLTKDPRKRITLEEVRHHEWTCSGLIKEEWLHESDPSRHAQGSKIEVSKEDVNTAVVPLNLVERVRSGFKKVLEKSGLTRARGHSNAGSSKGDSPVASAHSSSSSMNQDARRQSFRGDEQIFTALKASREVEHPLSKSVAASPELEKLEKDKYFDKLAPRENGNGSHDLTRVPSRPSPPNRAMTVESAAGSMRTVTQSDYITNGRKTSPPPSPGLPGTPTALASPGGSHLSGLFRQPGRILKSVRERSTNRRGQMRGLSSDRGSVESSDHHAEASIAVSQTNAAGHVNLPDALLEGTPASSARNSPLSSRAHSVTSDPHSLQQHLSPRDPGVLSRMSSTSSIASIGRQVSEAFRARPQSCRAPESSAEEWQRVDEERVRKLVRESEAEIEQARRSPHRRESMNAFDNRTCPTSPDDLRGKDHESRVSSITDVSTPDTPLDGLSPMNQTGQLPSAMVSSSSDLGSAVSMSISNPSIPSVISEASSVDLSDGTYQGFGEEKREPSSDDTLGASPKTRAVDDPDEGYIPDQEAALNSEPDDMYDSSSDSDGGLVMSRRRSAAKQGHGLIVSAEVPKHRRGTGLSARSKKSSRSGSNNTMKKVRTRDSVDESRSNDITEE